MHSPLSAQITPAKSCNLTQPRKQLRLQMPLIPVRILCRRPSPPYAGLTPFPAALTKNSPVSPFLATLTKTKDLNPIVCHTFSKLKLLGRYFLYFINSLLCLSRCTKPGSPLHSSHHRRKIHNGKRSNCGNISALPELSKPEPLITDYRSLVSRFLARKAPRV